VARNDSRDILYVANTTGWVVLPGGEEFLFRQGVTKVRADHPVMRACPRNFSVDDPARGVVDYVKR
jgi:hypothetical protein